MSSYSQQLDSTYNSSYTDWESFQMRASSPIATNLALSSHSTHIGDVSGTQLENTLPLDDTFADCDARDDLTTLEFHSKLLEQNAHMRTILQEREKVIQIQADELKIMRRSLDASKWVQENTKLHKLVADLKQQVQRASNEATDMSHHYKHDVDVLHHKLGKSEQDRKSCLSQLEKLHASMRRDQDKQSVYNQKYETQISNLKIERDHLYSEYERLKAVTMRSNEALRRIRNSEKTTCAALTAQDATILHLRQQLESSETEHCQNVKLVKTLRDELAAARNTIQELKASLYDVSKRYDACRETLADADATHQKLEQYQKELSRVEDANATLTSQINLLRAQHKDNVLALQNQVDEKNRLIQAFKESPTVQDYISKSEDSSENAFLRAECERLNRALELQRQGTEDAQTRERNTVQELERLRSVVKGREDQIECISAAADTENNNNSQHGRVYNHSYNLQKMTKALRVLRIHITELADLARQKINFLNEDFSTYMDLPASPALSSKDNNEIPMTLNEPCREIDSMCILIQELKNCFLQDLATVSGSQCQLQ